MNADGDPAEFEALLEYLKTNRGFDFTGYKRTSLVRRVQKRMETVGIETCSDYTDYLQVHPDEFSSLFDTILINVTDFFRDPLAWGYLSSEIVPRIMAHKRPDEPVRIWCAGCASGEEAYSLAIVMAEILGIEQACNRVKIYATDLDDADLIKARQATYGPKDVESLPRGVLETYFVAVNNCYVFHRELRRSVIFGRHDLLQDAPISRIDLLVCRNTLMYFNSESQARILARFHFALNDNGILFLGKAETLLTYNTTFTPIDLKWRVFAKAPGGQAKDRTSISARNVDGEAIGHLLDHARIRELAFDVGPLAQLAVDFNNILVLINERARELFGLGHEELGRPLQDLQLSYRPVDLRSCIDRVYSERRPVILKGVEWPTGNGEPMYRDVEIVPLQDRSGLLLGACVTFLDVTSYKRLQNDLLHSNHELQSAYEELQSTNEELETTNEELQSTNEELETLNKELRVRSDEHNQVNMYLESILAGLRGGVTVLDADLVVHIWNRMAEDLWGLRSEEVLGKHFMNLDIGLPVEQLRPLMRNCLVEGKDHQEVTLDASNRRGKPIRCKITCTPLIGMGEGTSGVILHMEPEPDGTAPPANVDGLPIGEVS